MTVKRSRSKCSSSNLAASVAADGSTVSVSPTKVMKKLVTDAGESSHEKIVPSGGECDRIKMGGFLERCYYCGKPIAQDSEVFMYRDLCAFCSVECRESQISIDQLSEKKSKNPKEKVDQGQGIDNVKGRFAS